ncbi:E3 ubiquitin-protein ligase SINA-like 2 [Panicum virgatum]|uniref:E3 ubiquitin-protein ligase SINA-like 2 n=1 Tax=Panicum virgatum TaxID=38727 RepID=UPI0019D53DC4|nr:E3 ubiquitin-protein ligase SINA-like 2 [Panicum virgatum]
MEGDGITGKRREGALEEGGSSAKRLKCSIEPEAFSCDACGRPLWLPIFLCSDGHFLCSSCRDELPEGKCSECSGALARSHVMERAVQSILVDCGAGCAVKTAYGRDCAPHRLICPYAPCECPEPGCRFAGPQEELLDHLAGHHKWPSTTFGYWAPFDLRVAEPGSHPAAEPHGYAVSLVRVQYINITGCSVSFSCSPRHRITAAVGNVWPLWYAGWPPEKYVCFVPKASDGPDAAAGIVLTINIDITPADDADEDDDPDYSSYVQSDEDDDGDSS